MRNVRLSQIRVQVFTNNNYLYATVINFHIYSKDLLSFLRKNLKLATVFLHALSSRSHRKNYTDVKRKTRALHLQIYERYVMKRLSSSH